MPVKMFVKKLYHATVPKSVRYPFGRMRRNLADSCHRLLISEPLPPRGLLRNVQMTPYIREYLDIGRKGATALIERFEQAGLSSNSKARVLDFGCGLSRNLRFLRATNWSLAGCDIDEQTVGWSRQAFADIEYAVNSTAPPLPWDAESFDGLFAVSVFTHFPASTQAQWAAELARVLKPEGVALITTMGPRAFGSFAKLATEENHRRFMEEGFLFNQQGDTFNSNGAFHTETGVRATFGDQFDLRSWHEGGLDGFQDLSVLIKSR